MSQYSRSHEPVVWSLFGAGGVVLAFLTPALVIITGFLLPTIFAAADPELVYRQTLELMQNWFVKLVFLAVVATQLFHAAHRIYHGLHDIHLRAPDGLMLWLSYGGASVLSVLTAVGLLVL